MSSFSVEKLPQITEQSSARPRFSTILADKSLEVTLARGTTFLRIDNREHAPLRPRSRLASISDM